MFTRQNSTESEIKQNIFSSFQKAEFTEKEREKLSKENKAQSDGSYPIRNVSDLKNAIQAFGRSKNPEKTKRWIIKRAKELGKESLLPEGWKEATQEDELQKCSEKQGGVLTNISKGAKFKDPFTAGYVGKANQSDLEIKLFQDINKSHVKGHTRTSKTGKVFQVKDYIDSRGNRCCGKHNTIKTYAKSKYQDEEGYTCFQCMDEHMKKEKKKEKKSKIIDPIEQNRLKSEKFVKNMPIPIRRMFDKYYEEKSNNNDLEIRLFEDISKAHIRSYQKRTKSGKIVQVREHEDSRKPQEKDLMRIKDIVRKSDGDKRKMFQLSQTMAKLITDPDKAHRRAVACSNYRLYDCANIFLKREKELKEDNMKEVKNKIENNEDNKDEKVEQLKEELKKTDYNFLLDSWNEIIEKNQNVIEALKQFAEENNLTEEDTKKFFSDRQKYQGKKIEVDEIKEKNENNSEPQKKDYKKNDNIKRKTGSNEYKMLGPARRMAKLNKILTSRMLKQESKNK